MMAQGSRRTALRRVVVGAVGASLEIGLAGVGSGRVLALLRRRIAEPFVSASGHTLRRLAATMRLVPAIRPPLSDTGLPGQQGGSAALDCTAELHSIFDNAAAGVTEIDASTNRFLRVNRVFCDMMGCSEAELFEMGSLAEMTHPEDRANQATQWADIRVTGRSYQCERRYRRPDGRYLWLSLGVSVAMSATDGRPLRYVTVAQDVTERKAAEAALQASQEMLRLSLDIGQVGTFQRDYRSGLIYCGRETRLMSGLPLDDAPIQAEAWFETVLPEDRLSFIQHAADAHAERREIVSFVYRFMHPEKGTRYAETRSRVDYDETGRAVSSIGVVIDVTDRRQTENRLAHLAHHDALTDLPNRTLFRIHLDEALARAGRGEPCAVLSLDLDHFKDVNDSLGHPVGDALLQAVTRRLRSACRPTDIVARLGGDEFAIIQHPLRDRADVVAFARQVNWILSKPYEIDGQRVAIGSSIGIVVAPDDGVDPDLLLRHADLALYSAKGAGRGCERLFRSAMSDEVQARRLLDSELRRALDEGEFELFYQPLISIATRRVRGFEALVRWRHPQRGLVMPDAFIPLAEANGLIVPIGAFVLRRACAEAASWPNDIGVAVNLSASEFASPDIVTTVADALARSGLAPKRLQLEITETTMLQDTQSTTEILQGLKALGVGISIDDFGTGFSSLAYLQRFQFDKVKIDRSFITPLGQTPQSLAIVGAVVNLCHGLGMEVTAEGVETEGHLGVLTDLNCTEAQGYLFSRPRPIGEVPALIERLDALARDQREAAPVTRGGSLAGDGPIDTPRDVIDKAA